MGYREIPGDRVLEFPATPGFKEWETFFTSDSTTHPAKMNLNLLHWIIETYTKPGEVVLDPMAGTGSTIILAALLGRHGIAVEYESRFCDMIRANIELTERQATLISKGRMTCIQGDARELSKLLSEADSIVTSPPYSDSLNPHNEGESSGDSAPKKRKRGIQAYSFNKENIGNLSYGDIDSIITSPPYSESMSKRRKGYTTYPELSRTRHMGEDSGDENIGNLPHGDIDSIITSPPYSDIRKKSKISEEDLEKKLAILEKGAKEGRYHSGGTDYHTPGRLKWIRGWMGETNLSEGNIGNLPHGNIDSIITSPPFGPSQTGGGIFKEGYKAPGEEEVSDPGLPQRHARPLSDDPRNIDNLEYGESVDAVITSPPYEESKAFHDIKFMKSIAKEQDEKARKGETKSHYRTEEAELRYLNKIESGKIEDPDNIGSMKGETYLEAMLKVYRECFSALKPMGKMVIVVKNFIREKAIVRLDLDTIRLCEAAGFTLSDHWYFKLPTRSFWRILYRKKHPEVPEVEFEDVLVFDKGVDIPRVNVKEIETDE